MCPSCYVVAGYGVRGTDDKESPEPNLTKRLVYLKIDDLVAVTTWLYVHDGQRPPSPAVIVKAFRKFMTPEDWKAVTTIPPPMTVNVSLFATGEESIAGIFRAAACIYCHVIPGVPDAAGTIGPVLTMKSTAPLRLKDPKYRGKATTPWEYIYESILKPSVYLVQPFPDDVMPKVYGHKLTALALDKIVDYLAEIEEDKEPPPIK